MEPNPPDEQLTIMSAQILNRIDPLRKQSERGLDGAQGLSPMDPPDAYAPPGMEPVPAENLHPFLRKFCDEHIAFAQELDAFEEAILRVQEAGYTREADASLRQFFELFDRDFVSHYRQEEAMLFPLLHERLIACGEHGKGDNPLTAVNVMVDEHTKAVQLAAVIVNFLGLVFRLPDHGSRMIVLDVALEQSKQLVELLRLHLFRENNVTFSLAQRLIVTPEFDDLQSRAAITARSG